MADTISSVMATQWSDMHQLVLKVAGDLSAEQLNWRPSSVAPSMGFHLWHIARCADVLQATMTPSGHKRQVWETEGVAAQWGIDSRYLRDDEVGTGLDDEESTSLPLPHKDILVDYARRVFALANEAVSHLDDQQLHELYTDRYGMFTDAVGTGLDRDIPVVRAVVSHMSHGGRHLGMIEALRGVQGVRGSATG